VISVVIDEQFRDLIPPLADDERAHLRQSIVDEGCREPITVWQEKPCIQVIIDGHNRHDICKELDVPFDVRPVEFGGRDDVTLWMINNQLGRRNLSPADFKMLIGRKYNATKKAHGGTGANQHKEQSGQNDHSATADAIADEHGISEATVRRAAKLAQKVDEEKKGAAEKGEKLTDKQAVKAVKQKSKEVRDPTDTTKDASASSPITGNESTALFNLKRCWIKTGKKDRVKFEEWKSEN
jgi:transposase-like protein